jgi:hypothetical protein
VRHDSTLIILHSGNLEYVCVRHRASQTLYVSELIDVPRCANPGYGKLHTGIYIAAIQDAMQRIKNMAQTPVDESPDIGEASEKNGNSAGDDRHPGDRRKGSGKGKERERDGNAGHGASRKAGDEVGYDLEADQAYRQDTGRCDGEQVQVYLSSHV